MPSMLGHAVHGNSTLDRLARFFREEADPWERLEVAVPPQVFSHASTRTFSHYLDGPSRVQIRSLDDLCAWLRACEAIDDPTLFREPDHWQHPVAFEQLRRGDCEDHALWAWRQLLQLGVPALFVAGLWRTTAHAWVVVHHQGTDFVLETTAKSGPMLVPVGSARTEYCPALAVDHRLQTYVYQGYQHLHRHARHRPTGAVAKPGPDFEIAILAGGHSSRMGRDKSRILLDGQTLLSRIRTTARSLGRPVHVIRKDLIPGLGPLGGLLTGLRRARAPVVMVLSCDMPAITPALLNRVVHGFRQHTQAVFTSSRGRSGFPFAVRRDVRPALRECLGAGRLALHQFASLVRTRTVRVAPRDSAQLTNLNTPADLDAFLERTRKPTSATRRPIVGRLATFLVATLVSLAGIAPGKAAPPPPAESWLPAETIAFVTVPAAASARTHWARHGPAQFWSDPAMAGLRTRFEQELRARLLDPIHAVTGLHPGRILALAEGQLTLALLPSSKPAGAPEAVLYLDAGTRAPELAPLMAAAIANPHLPAPTRTWQIASAEGASLSLAADRLDQILEAAFPRPDPAGKPPATPVPPAPVVLHVARIGTGLLATTATTPEALSGMLARLRTPPAPGTAPLASRNPALTRDAARWSSGTLAHGWASVPAVLATITNAPAGEGAASPLGLIPTDRLIAALGLHDLVAASFAIRADDATWSSEFRLAIPPAARKGLFELIAIQALDASPPDWVGDDILSFRRIRMPGPAAWAGLERLLLRLDPALLGVLQLFTQYAGRTEDADFRFDRDLVPKLGDDWIAVSRQVTNRNVFGAGMIVLGGTNAPLVHHALTLIAAPAYLSTFLPPGTPAPPRAERSVAGHRVIQVGLPPMPWQDGIPRQLHLATRDRWVALAGTGDTIDGFLTRTHAAAPLARAAAFKDALARAGGPSGGWVAYRQEREALRHVFDLLRDSPEPLNAALRWAAVSETATRAVSALVSWIDLSRLPAFDTVAHHFRFHVETGRADPEGFVLTTVRPSGAPAGSIR